MRRQSEIRNSKIFELYCEDQQNVDRQEYSVNDVFEMAESELTDKIFCIRSQILISDSIEPEMESNQQFFKFKVERIKRENEAMLVLKITDITINIRLQQSQQQKQILQMVNACVSHEMRNPINAIFAMNMQLRDQASELAKLLTQLQKEAASRNCSAEAVGQLVKQCQEIQADMTKHADIQESSTKLLNFYVADLLSLSQINKKKFRKNISKFDIREAVQEIVEIQRDKLSFNRINLKTEYLGFENENYQVFTDKMRLQQVLLNYQSNAIKFTPKQGKILIRCIKHEFLGDHGEIQIKVIDNGVGIKDEDKEKLFKIFGYLDRTKELNSNGIGLGLYITKMIVKQFQGQVSVESEPGRGSTFNLAFKLSKQEADQGVKVLRMFNKY